MKSIRAWATPWDVFVFVFVFVVVCLFDLVFNTVSFLHDPHSPPTIGLSQVPPLSHFLLSVRVAPPLDSLSYWYFRSIWTDDQSRPI